jgi:hypothetical protein
MVLVARTDRSVRGLAVLRRADSAAVTTLDDVKALDSGSKCACAWIGSIEITDRGAASRSTNADPRPPSPPLPHSSQAP